MKMSDDNFDNKEMGSALVSVSGCVVKVENIRFSENGSTAIMHFEFNIVEGETPENITRNEFKNLVGDEVVLSITEALKVNVEK